MHVGKDTAGAYLVSTHGFYRFAFADSLKRGVQEMAGFSTEQCWGESKDITDEFWGVTPRKMLQEVGMFMRENYHPDFWAIRLRKFAEENPEKDIVVTDVRFPNETALIEELGGYVLRIHRDATQQDHHISEEQTFEVSKEILNNSTVENLCAQVDSFLEEKYGGI